MTVRDPEKNLLFLWQILFRIFDFIGQVQYVRYDPKIPAISFKPYKTK